MIPEVVTDKKYSMEQIINIVKFVEVAGGLLNIKECLNKIPKPEGMEYCKIPNCECGGSAIISKEEPRGSQFRRVEEQQKIIAEYRVALEAAKKHIEIAIGKDGAKVSTVWNIINKALKVTKGE